MMKKLLLILVILLAMSLVALLIFQFRQMSQPEAATTVPTDTTGTGDAPTGTESEDPTEPTVDEGPTAPPYTFPGENPTDPEGTDPTGETEETPTPTAEPGLDENETPRMEF